MGLLAGLLTLCLVAGASAQLASLKPIGASQALDVSVSDDGAFELRFGGSAWFRGGDVKVRSDGAAYSLAMPLATVLPEAPDGHLWPAVPDHDVDLRAEIADNDERDAALMPAD